MYRPRLSVVTIAKNEEKNVRPFIESFTDVADEIVIIDDGSVDQTVSLALRAAPHVRVIVSPRGVGEGFCDQRMKGCNAATGDWLLHADMDMRLSARLAHEILGAVQNCSRDAYRFRLKHFLVHRRVRFGAPGRWNEPWLVRKGAGVWTRSIHERSTILSPKGRIGQLQGRMWHINDATWDERVAKGVRYAMAEADHITDSGMQVRLSTVILRPLWIAFKGYVLSLGFLDGRIGLYLSLHSYCVVLNGLLLAWERQNRLPRQPLEEQVRQESGAGEQIAD